MLKNKRILSIILVSLLLLILPNMVNASNETPTIKTEVYGANKSIKVTLTDITIDDLNEHKFGISKAKATEPTEWLDLQEIESSTCTAIITPENETHRTILRSGNKCYLFIKNITDGENVIITQIDLSQELGLSINNKNEFVVNYLYEKCNTFYENLGDYQIAAVKIDDKDIIKEYLAAKENNQNTLNAVKDMLTIETPTNWTKMDSGNDFTSTSAEYSIKNLIKYEGLYMVWGSVSYIEGRNICGFILYDNYPNDYVLPEENEPTTPPTTDEPTTPPTTDKPTTPPTTDEPIKPPTTDEPTIDKTQDVDDKKQTNTNKDTTIAPGTMPYTGGTFIIIGIIGIVLLGIYTYKRNKDLKGI